ncbi:MAG: hypothetical protein LBT51_09005 [Fusobacteriaceae bacterium]|jgi:hypothetical protein|nr:hypothetical protein [Fusobacteriaceae bacterium]
MTDEERKKLQKEILEKQKKLATEENIILPYNIPEDILIPDFEYNDLDYGILKLLELKKIEDIDDGIFANWKAADLPVMFIAGGLGTLTSSLLKDFFNDFHNDRWSKKKTLAGGHSGEAIDRVPGSKQPGGFGHRWKFGHDLLNPFEVSWDQYFSLAKESGGILPGFLKAPFYWLKHLLQDTFSTEGLPMVGNSLFRDFLDPATPTNRKLLQLLGTIKMRDLAGTAVTNTIMGAYLWKTEGNLNQVIAKPNYRSISLMMGANAVMVLSGLLNPVNPSLNWGGIPTIAYYAYQLIKLEKQIRKLLNQRKLTLNENFEILDKNEKNLMNTMMLNDYYMNLFSEYEDSINESYRAIMERHEMLKTKIMGGE